MKSRRCSAFVLMLAVVSLLLLSTLAARPVAAQDDQDENWILERRGYDFELYRNAANPNLKRWTNAPEWVWDGANYQPYIFAPDYPCSDGSCLLMRNGYISAEVYSYYAKYFDLNYTEVRLFMEQWEVQQWQTAGKGKWQSVIMPSPSLLPWAIEVTANSSGVFLTQRYTNWAGELDVIYILREACPLKHDIRFKSAIAGTTDFRVVQHWSGIVGNKAGTRISGPTLIDSTVFVFQSADNHLMIVEDQSAAPQLVRPVTIDVDAQGMKADFIFEKWSLPKGGALLIDPTTYTFQPSSADNTLQYPGHGNYGGFSTLYVYAGSPTALERIILKFDMSSQIPAASIINSATLYLYMYSAPTESRTYWAYRVTETDWVEGTGGGAPQTGSSDWNDRVHDTVAWTNAGGTYTATDGASTATGIVSGVWLSWTVTAQVQTAVDSVGRVAHFLVKDEAESADRRGDFYSKEEISEVFKRPKLQVDWTSAPTVDSFSLDLTGATVKGTKTLLCAKQDYNFTLTVSDAVGIADINYAMIRLDPSGKDVRLRWTRGTGVFSEDSDPSDYVTLNTGTSSAYSASATQEVIKFYVTINWAWGDSADTVGIRGYVTGTVLADANGNYTNVFGVEAHLTSSGLAVNDYRVDPSATLTMSGAWYYDGTAVAPPDGDYQVIVKLTGVQKGSTDTTLVSGAFSINDVAAEASVNSYSYTVEATHMSGAGSFSAVIVDRPEFWEWGTTDADKLVNKGDSARIYVRVSYDYDSSAFTSANGSLWINATAATYSIGDAYWYIDKVVSSVSNMTFGVSSFTDVSQGLTTSTTTGASVYVQWTELSVSAVVVSATSGSYESMFNVTVLWAHNSTAARGGSFAVYNSTHQIASDTSDTSGVAEFTLSGYTLHGSGSLTFNGSISTFKVNTPYSIAYAITASSLAATCPSQVVSGNTLGLPVTFTNAATIAATGVTLDNITLTYRVLSGIGVVLIEHNTTLASYASGAQSIPSYTLDTSALPAATYTARLVLVQHGTDYTLAQRDYSFKIVPGEASTGGNPPDSPTAPSLALLVPSGIEIERNSSRTVDVTFSWKNVAAILVTGVELTGAAADWVTVVSPLPNSYSLDISGNPKGQLTIKISVPSDAPLGSQELRILLQAKTTVYTLEATENLLFSVTETVIPPEIAGNPLLVVGAIGAVAAVSPFIYRKIKSRDDYL